jgi:transposase
VVSCYEAGRDGFWLHRYLVSLGIENQVVDSSSIETNRRERRAKTDRLDGVKLLTMLMRYWAGERGLWSVVRVPNVEEEDARRVSEEGAHPASQSDPRLVSGAGPAPGASSRLSKASRTLTRWDGTSLPAELKGELEREYRRLSMVEEQLRALEQTRTERIAHADSHPLRQVVRLMGLRAIGPGVSEPP